VHVGLVQRGEAGRLAGDAVRGEVFAAIVLVPDQGVPARIAPVVDPAAGHDVEVAIAVDVAYRGGHRAVEAAYVAEGELHVAEVLQRSEERRVGKQWRLR